MAKKESEKKESKGNVKRMTIHSDDDTKVEIEKISNGWLIIEEKRIKTKNGFPDFESKKTYVQENPVKNIQIPK